ncbi:unnamed protein product [Musa acuminata subsp. malaccensis]|uniref:(wild Malaysian banana) hypothetical protein n=1 Tax=Musa acuminata subsp. malaccensis TaxID=214687 RepID=A0A804JD24_MUSAM|nr:PREDICTED: uncharacterized protein LOC103988220 [Musa acuminata subsp. malaccensis]CAG1845390.1 unnamed protein product [Musa acuminata subsp. malaccensis]
MKRHLTVEVGLQNEEGDGGLQKLTMPVTYINHPYFAGLLDRAKKVYGYRSGAPVPLKLPCTVEEFIHVKSLVERESSGRGGTKMKGHLTVEVGLQNEEGDGGLQKLTMPVTYINHPYFAGLLDRAKKVYGYRSGAPVPLKLPCTVEEFIHFKSLVERESSGSQ